MAVYKMSIGGRVLVIAGRLFRFVFSKLPQFGFLDGTRCDQNPILLKDWFKQRVLGINGGAYWPMHSSSQVCFANRIVIGLDTCPGLMPGCSLNGYNGISIGDFTQIAHGVSIQSSNHDVYDLRKMISAKPILIGRHCWIGANSVILPEVQLGDHTVVGAGSIVTKSFKEGYCIVAGNPARIIRNLDPQGCKTESPNNGYYGYIHRSQFNDFKKKYLWGNIVEIGERNV